VRFAALACGAAVLAGCATAGGEVRRQAAADFGCPEDRVAVDALGSRYVATGCEKKADYVVQDGRAIRRSAITRGPPTRQELPIDRIPGTNSIGID
jgi:hypothetical protein